MGENQKFALRVPQETLDLVENIYEGEGFKSKSAFIDAAIHFYAGFLTSKKCEDYFPEVIVSSVKGTVDMMEHRLSALTFKCAVEMSMLMHIAAANFRIDVDTLERLREKCIQDVKRSNGQIDFADIVRYQKDLD